LYITGKKVNCMMNLLQQGVLKVESNQTWLLYQKDFRSVKCFALVVKIQKIYSGR
jgi:hypothetical protein